MAIKLISNYQAWWDSQANLGYFWFTYLDGVRQRTGPVGSDSFRVVLDILRNEKPVYGDHNTAMVTTAAEPSGEGEL